MSSRWRGVKRIIGFVGSGVVVTLVLSAGACNNFDSVPIPPPGEVGATAFPEGATVGGLDATFGMTPTATGGEYDGCGSYYRFRPDGSVALTYWDCQRDAESFDEFVERAANYYASSHGDYAVLGQQVWIRVVERDMLAQEMLLYELEAEICGDRMTPYNPGSVIPWTASLPVGRNLVLLSGVPAATADPCDVPTFTITRRQNPFAGVDDAELTIATEPGRACSMTYVGPDGVRFPAEGSLDLIADDTGECTFTFSPGSEAGFGTATVTVGRFSRDVELRVFTDQSTTTTAG